MMKPLSIFIITGDPHLRASVATQVETIGHAAEAHCGAAAATNEIMRNHDRAALIVADEAACADGHASASAFVAECRKRWPALGCIILADHACVDRAVEVMRCGALDYLVKPVDPALLRESIERGLRHHSLHADAFDDRDTQESVQLGMGEIIGSDQRMQRIFEIVEAVADSRTTVLMRGESGTGKSLIARAVHQRSSRATGPYVELSCGSIPETLLESELFGHMRGAFTGAHADKIGRFLAAHGGTIFLDEINSASPAMQLKLLRVLQERRFEPVGSNEPVEVDVRVILASNQPLEELVTAGSFRQDLYYRINVVEVDLPPLRQRAGDIPLLAHHFLKIKANDNGRTVRGFDAAAIEAMRNYAFPGNVRELENIIERAVVLTRGSTITIDDLPTHVVTNTSPQFLRAHGGDAANLGDAWNVDAALIQSLRDALEEPEKRIILAALRANEWNRQRTAEQLDINRTTLYKKMKQYDLERHEQA